MLAINAVGFQHRPMFNATNNAMRATRFSGLDAIPAHLVEAVQQLAASYVVNVTQANKPAEHTTKPVDIVLLHDVESALMKERVLPSVSSDPHHPNIDQQHHRSSLLVRIAGAAASNGQPLDLLADADYRKAFITVAANRAKA